MKWNSIVSDCVCNNNAALAWSSPYFRFDDILLSFFSVFLIARGAQWDYFLYESYSTHGIGENEKINIHDTPLVSQKANQWNIRDNEIVKLQKILCKLVELPSHSILKTENEELKRRLQSYNNHIIM